MKVADDDGTFTKSITLNLAYRPKIHTLALFEFAGIWTAESVAELSCIHVFLSDLNNGKLLDMLNVPYDKEDCSSVGGVPLGKIINLEAASAPLCA